MKSGLATRVLGILVLVLVSFGCDGSTQKLRPLPKETFEKVESSIEVSFTSRADILIVVDGSGSMGGFQTNVRNNIHVFIDEISKLSYLDYRIAVTISGCQRMAYHAQYSRGCTNSGIFHTANIADPAPYFVSRGDARATDTLRDRLNVGIGNDTSETFFGPVLDALTPPISLNPSNIGFLRPEAYFIPIFITDTEDQTQAGGSHLSPRDFYSELIRIKGRRDLIIPYSAHIPSTLDSLPRGCTRDAGGINAGVPLRIEEFISMADGLYFNMCDNNFGRDMSAVAQDLMEKIVPVIYLEDRPHVPSIELRVGKEVIPNDFESGWVYDPIMNAIRISKELAIEDEDAEISLTYIKANEFGD